MHVEARRNSPLARAALRSRTTGGLAALALAFGALAGSAPPAAAATNPLLGAALLQGGFQMVGVVTRAVGVPGEHLGQTFDRTWTFAPLCPIGQCAAVQLARPRAGGTDQVLLRLQGPGAYSGSGMFFAAARCHHRLYRRGERVPYTVTLNISAATPFAPGGPVFATQLRATYENRRRFGLTPCVSPLSHDSASYIGQRLPAPPS